MRRMSGRYSCVELGGGGAGRGVSNCEPRYEPRRSERACQRDRGEAVLLEPRAPGAECSLVQLSVSRIRNDPINPRIQQQERKGPKENLRDNQENRSTDIGMLRA